ncbi:MAG: protein NLRC3-like [Rickettsiales bacterium]|jgi:Ran GTPase-activating protein (RanGAP) involved in mRNA processing and transport|nr:protein NLRC3-like [Rickettsiales bacterium]
MSKNRVDSNIDDIFFGDDSQDIKISRRKRQSDDAHDFSNPKDHKKPDETVIKGDDPTKIKAYIKKLEHNETKPSLTLRNFDFSEKNAQHLLTALASNKSVSSLRLSSCKLDTPAAQAAVKQLMAPGSRFTRLTVRTQDPNKINALLNQLADAPNGSLKHIDFSGANLTPDHIDRLQGILQKNTSLEKVNLPTNIDPQQKADLASALTSKPHLLSYKDTPTPSQVNAPKQGKTPKPIPDTLSVTGMETKKLEKLEKRLQTPTDGPNNLTLKSVEFNEKTPHAISVLKALENNTKVTHLELKNCFFDTTGVQALLVMRKQNPKLDINLKDCTFSAQAAQKLQEANIKNPNLGITVENPVRKGADQPRVALSNVLRNNEYPSNELKLRPSVINANSSAITVLEGLKNNTNVTHLVLPNSRFSSSGAKALATVLQNNKTITSLDLSGSILHASSDRKVTITSVLAKNNTLTDLNLANCQVDNVGAKALGTMLKENTKLRTLDLTGSKMNEKGAGVIAEALKSNTGLQNLKLGLREIELHKSSRYGKDAIRMVEKFANAKDSNASIELTIEKSYLSSHGMKALLEATKNNPNLKIDLKGCELSPKAAKLLEKAQEEISDLRVRVDNSTISPAAVTANNTLSKGEDAASKPVTAAPPSPPTPAAPKPTLSAPNPNAATPPAIPPAPTPKKAVAPTASPTVKTDAAAPTKSTGGGSSRPLPNIPTSPAASPVTKEADMTAASAPAATSSLATVKYHHYKAVNPQNYNSLIGLMETQKVEGIGIHLEEVRGVQISRIIERLPETQYASALKFENCTFTKEDSEALLAAVKANPNLVHIDFAGKNEGLNNIKEITEAIHHNAANHPKALAPTTAPTVAGTPSPAPAALTTSDNTGVAASDKPRRVFKVTLGNVIPAPEKASTAEERKDEKASVSPRALSSTNPFAHKETATPAAAPGSRPLPTPPVAAKETNTADQAKAAIDALKAAFPEENSKPTPTAGPAATPPTPAASPPTLGAPPPPPPPPPMAGPGAPIPQTPLANTAGAPTPPPTSVIKAGNNPLLVAIGTSPQDRLRKTPTATPTDSPPPSPSRSRSGSTEDLSLAGALMKATVVPRSDNSSSKQGASEEEWGVYKPASLNIGHEEREKLINGTETPKPIPTTGTPQTQSKPTPTSSPSHSRGASTDQNSDLSVADTLKKAMIARRKDIEEHDVSGKEAADDWDKPASVSDANKSAKPIDSTLADVAKQAGNPPKGITSEGKPPRVGNPPGTPPTSGQGKGGLGV